MYYIFNEHFSMNRTTIVLVLVKLYIITCTVDMVLLLEL